MRSLIIAAISIAGLAGASFSAAAQDAAVRPGSQGTAPLTSGTGSGADSKITGYSEGGRGGTGGEGGILSNGTSDGAGTATGGNPGGKSSQGGGGS